MPITRSAYRGRYGGRANSAVELFAAGLTPGTWTQMTGASLPSGLNNFVGGPASGIATHFAQNMAYDPAGRVIYWIGCDHGQDQKFIQYDEVSNAFVLNAATPFAAATKHGYNHSVWVAANKSLWHRPFSTLGIYRWNGGGSWSFVDYSGVAFAASAANGCAYHPGLGKIIIYQLENGTNGMVIGVDPITNAVSTIVAEAGGTLSGSGGPHNFAVYNPVSDVVFFGGGNGTAKCWTINAAGTVVAKADIPAPLGAMGPTTDASRIFAHPTNGKFIAIKEASIWYEFDPGANTWTALGGTVSMLSANTYNGTVDGVVGVDLRAYGVLFCVKAYSSGADAQVWLYKP